MSIQRQIVPGISVDAQGQASIDPSLSEMLFDLALKLEEVTDLPVDIQHVVAALVLAQRTGELPPNRTIKASDDALISLLAVHVKSVFSVYGGEPGSDD